MLKEFQVLTPEALKRAMIDELYIKDVAQRFGLSYKSLNYLINRDEGLRLAYEEAKELDASSLLSKLKLIFKYKDIRLKRRDLSVFKVIQQTMEAPTYRGLRMITGLTLSELVPSLERLVIAREVEADESRFITRFRIDRHSSILQGDNTVERRVINASRSVQCDGYYY